VPKIAYLTPLYFADESYIGGGERYPTNLARGVAIASGGAYRVELISFGPSSAHRELAPGVSLRVLPASRVPANPLDVLSWDLPDALVDADLVHIHQAFTRCAEVGMLVAKGLHKPVFVTDHGGDTSNLGRHYGILELADRIVPNSDFGGSFFLGSTPVEVVKGGVDADAFTPAPRPSPRSHILFVGRLLPHKGIDRLINAVPPDMPLVVCGRPYRPEYFDRLRGLAEGKNVEFVTDAADADLPALYRSAWATVLPSVHTDCYGDFYAIPELMGFTLLESMACGTPAIGSNLAGMPEFIRPGETGFVFDTEDELRGQLETLASDPSLVERMGREARRAIETEFSLTVAGATLVRLYDRQLSRVTGQGAAA
jgi:glycosyltransferase involved in cell wall biosynthesis